MLNTYDPGSFILALCDHNTCQIFIPDLDRDFKLKNRINVFETNQIAIIVSTIRLTEPDFYSDKYDMCYIVSGTGTAWSYVNKNNNQYENIRIL